MPAAVIVLLLAVGGGLVLREVYPARGENAAGTDPPPWPIERDEAEQPGDPQVRLSEAASRHPQHTGVREALQTYFDAINERDFELWRSVVTAERAEGTDAAQWREDFRSTQDGDMYVHRIEPAADQRLLVLLSFTSTQDVVDAPPTLPEPCIHWWLALPLTEDGDGGGSEAGDAWRIDTVPPGTPPVHQPC
ncbi:hypothetical protein F8178_09750 [Haloechinothrix sp. LS1_15]|nr:hypothetical protein [Haloechinothrix sp. LS1_15]